MHDMIALDAPPEREVAPPATIAAHHVLPRVHEEASGTAYAVPSLCEALMGEHVRPTLHTLRIADGATFPFPVHVYPATAGLERLGVAPQMQRALNQISGERAVVHNSSLWMLPNIYAGLGARAAGVPLIVSPHGTLSEWAMARSRVKKKVAWWALGQKRALEATTAFHATAEPELDDVRRLGYRQPVAVIPNGFAPVPAPTAEARARRTTRRLLYFGRIHPKKGVLELIEMWGRLAAEHPGWELVIAGKNDNADYTEQVRQAAERAPRCTVQGPAYGADKDALYASSDVLVLYTHSENFGLVIPEALSAEVPCIVTHGAPWEGLPQHGCGWWIPRTEDALEGALREAMTMPEAQRREMGHRGREWAEEAFSWKHVGQEMRALYAWVLGLGDRPACVVTD